MKDKKTVIFIHVPKTAGTTLTNIILKQYEETETWQMYKSLSAIGMQWVKFPLPEQEKIARNQFRQIPPIKAIIGHINYGYHEYLEQPFTYISMLRNLKSRIISSYYFSKFSKTKNNYYRDLINNNKLTCKDWATSNLIPDNPVTRQISGIGDNIDYGLLKRQHLEIAKKNIEQHFSVVGLTEKFDDSLMLFKQHLGWKIPFYQSTNVNKKRPREENPKDVIKAIERTHELDLELYEYVKKRFEQQIEEGNIREEAARLKKLNYLYNTRPVSFLRRGLKKGTSLISKIQKGGR